MFEYSIISRTQSSVAVSLNPITIVLIKISLAFNENRRYCNSKLYLDIDVQSERGN
jgi:hypothetical protein